MANKKTFLGYVGVDSGRIAIVDPCVKLDELVGTEDDPQLCYPSSRFGAAVVSPTRNGDGQFPVFGFYNSEGELVRITIEFPPLFT